MRLGWEPSLTGITGLAPVAPARAFTAAAAAGIRSDEFNAATLDTTVWTEVDPVGDTTVTMTGTQAQLALPAGTRHDIWGAVDEVPRLMQSATNEDFEVEVKFDSAVTSGFQLQGLLVQQDAANKLRLEVHHDGGGAHLFVAGWVGGSSSTIHYSDITGAAPAYLRLKRTGNSWTFSHSSNGSAWTTAPSFTFPLTVTAIGPFAGNSGGTPPAFTSSIDYFREVTPAPPAADTTPPVISAVSAAASGVGAVVTWTTNETSTSRVDSGTSSTYGTTTSASGSTTSHRVTLAGLACATTYHYEVRSTDAAGNEGRSGDRSFTTASCPTALTSDEFNTGSLNAGLWAFVDPVGDSSVSMSGSEAVLSVPGGSGHDFWAGVDGLARLAQAAPNANFEVEAKFNGGVSAGYQMQGLLVQQDAANALRLEVHHDGGGAHLFAAGLTDGNASTLHYSNVAAAATVYLRLKRTGDSWTFSYSSDGTSWTSTTFTRAMTVRSIGPFAGNSGSSPPAFSARVDYFRVVPADNAAPVLGAISVTSGPIGAAVTWTTNEPASSRVDYGATASYGSTASRSAQTTGHSISLTGLACATTYHYEIRSTDASGNEARSGDRTFTTAACPTSLSSDEFNTTTLDATRWSRIDPVGDTSLTLNGSQAVFALPAGSRHDLWTGADEVPRILQATPDDDFDVEVKFDNPVAAMYQLQGLLVQQDAANLLRIEVHHDGETRLFVAGLTGGSASTIHQSTVAGGAPVYLRLKRKGSTWTLRYSNDHTTWTSTTFTRALTVRAVGPFAGNSGNNPPAFTSAIDYFRYFPPDKTAPQLTGITATPSAIGARIAWTTDEPATDRRRVRTDDGL